MEVVLLEKDGRCLWLENKVLNDILPKAIKSAANPFAKKLYLIIDWISNDYGKVGVDLKWLRGLGVPTVRNISELPHSKNIKVVNTGYDSIYNEEKLLSKKGYNILDKPCPYIRRIRDIFESNDDQFQYVLLCEPNHIIIKNFATLFPDDLIVLQMENYKEILEKNANSKPKRLVPYVTFLRSDVSEIMSYINNNFPETENDLIETSCLWIKSKASPIIEIEKLSKLVLKSISDAVLITTANSTNKSLISLEKSLQKKGLRVVQISSLWSFLNYKIKHENKRVLVVRSPIPNNAEGAIMKYIQGGIFLGLLELIKQSYIVKKIKMSSLFFFFKLRYCLLKSSAYLEAKEMGLLRDEYTIDKTIPLKQID